MMFKQSRTTANCRTLGPSSTADTWTFFGKHSKWWLICNCFRPSRCPHKRCTYCIYKLSKLKSMEWVQVVALHEELNCKSSQTSANPRPRHRLHRWMRM